MESWITWFIAVGQTSVQWLASMEIMDVPVLWIIGAVFVMGVMFRAFLFKA